MSPLVFLNIQVNTVIGTRMSHWKWRKTKLQPSKARSGHQISCCLVSLHFLCDILAPITVLSDLQCKGTLFQQTLQVQLLEHLECPDLLADGYELVVPQGEYGQLLEPADGGGDAGQLVVRQVQGL